MAAKTMVLRLARIGVYLGMAMVVAGLVIGFGAMFADLDDLALVFLRLVPVGFVIGFAGLAISLLHGSRS